MPIRPVALAMMLVLASPALAHSPGNSTHTASRLPAAAKGAAATVDAFHAALRKGNRKAALALLADDALIFEAGGVERSKAEYAAEHLGADIEFSHAVPSATTSRAGGSDGKLAWVASEGRIKGEFLGRSVDRVTTETMLLRRVGGAWKIAHIHWSSGAAPTASVAAVAVPLLTGSTPANGAVIEGPLNALELRFSPPARLHEVTIAGPGGTMPMMVTATGENAHYSIPLPGLEAGTYTVDWRATASSREERGTFVFTVR